MRLLIVSQYFYPEEFKINQLARALSGAGHELVVLTGQPNYPTGRFFPGYGVLRPLNEQYGDVQVVRVPIFPRHSGRDWQLALNYFSFAASATLFGLPRLRGRFDACLAFCPSPITTAVPAIVYRYFRKVPVALWLQDLWPESVLAVSGNRSRWFQGGLERLVRWVYAHVDQIWIQSRAYAESVAHHGARPDGVSYVPNWAEDLYDCERWADVAPEQLPPHSLVFAGNLGRTQGIPTLIDAAEIAKSEGSEIHWVFVGDGSLRSWLEHEVRRRSLTDHVTLYPRRSPQDMPPVLMAASALLVTLGGEPVFRQTVPSKMQSCLASGRPVIAAVSGEAARIIETAECGYVCRPDDPRSIAAAANRLIALPPEERMLLGRRGHAYYKAHFTQSRISAQIMALLEELRAGNDRTFGSQGKPPL